MKSLLMRLGVIWIMLTSMLPAVFSQGLLVIEISDTLNAPLKDYVVKITNSNGITRSYKTNSEGRVEENSLSVGDYTYSFSYGDYNTGSFTIKSGEPTWIDLDYRRVTINFKDDKGDPSSGNFVTFYKIEEDGTRTLVAQKTSNDSGKVQFVVPKGNYTYVAADGAHNIVVDADNINTSVNVSSRLVTYQTAFRFVKNGKEVTLNANDVTVYQTQNGKDKAFGVVLAHGDSQTSGYVEYSITDGKISCPVGEYKYSVDTKEYGRLTGTFFVTQLDSQTNNIVDIIISSDDDDDGDDNDGEEDKDIITPDESKPLYCLNIHIEGCTNANPVKDIVNWYSVPNQGRSTYSKTNKYGDSNFRVNEGFYDIHIIGYTEEAVYVNKDTTIVICLGDGPIVGYQEIYFQFFYKDEEVFPQTINEIEIDKIEGNDYIPYASMYPRTDSFGVYKFLDPLITFTGEYSYYFRIDEFEATYRTGNFETDTLKPKDTVRVYFEHRVNVDLYVVRDDTTSVDGMYTFSYKTENSSTSRNTDSTGHFKLTLEPGEYIFSSLGQTKTVSLDNDTTLYFFISGKEPDPNREPESNPSSTREVYFKFIQDGKEVYPNVTSLVFYKDNMNNRFAYLPSSLYTGYAGLKEAYVFDKPIELPSGSYTASYFINEDDFNGQMYREFDLNTSPNDTTIYIIVPVKKTIEIQIKDAKGTDVQGVFAKIYKYDEDGNLSPYLVYDGKSHTNLMSDATGVVHDYLAPGRYQIQILDIVRDFDVNDYDLRFSVVSNAKMYDIKFKVLYRDDNSPVSGLKLDVKKEDEFYNSAITDTNGEINFQSEVGLYSYTLYYDGEIKDKYTVSKNVEIVIYIDRPIPVKNIAIISNENCLVAGESTKLTAIVTPTNADIQDIEWIVDNNILAKISNDGILTANNIETNGVVNVIAKAKDGSEVADTITINIEVDKCIKAYTLTFGDGSTEMWLDDYTFDLVITPLEDKNQYYAYQTSQDGINWVSAADFAQDTKVTISSDKYLNNGVHYFRVVASEDAFELIQIIDNIIKPSLENITNIIVLHSYDNEDTPIADKIEIPTVFTPHEVNGANDDFMPGYTVVIYNRFGDVICKSDNGWDGKYKGETADAGVYIYVLTLKDGTEKRGTIQLYRK